MKHIGSDTSAAPRVFHMTPGDFAIAAKNLCNGAWTMQQAWLSAPEKNLRAGMVRFGWEPDAFWVLADLHDDFITSRSTDHNQDMWLLGDVFEIFIARKNSPHYLELHVTPHNHRMHLKLTAEDLEKIRSKHATLDEFRKGECSMERINRSHLFLLPKCEGAERAEDFRPISLSNSIYLIIAKVLANRLRGVINDLIGPSQSAFIPGRQLVDSVVAAGEIISAWQRNKTKGFMWKVDFAKAFDSV